MMDLADPWDELDVPTTRRPRTVENRANDSRKRSWVQPSVLPDVQPRDGWSFKWVRSEARNQLDKTNMDKKMREGWEVVDLKEHPDVAFDIGREGKHGTVEIGGLILCKMPEEFVRQRNEHYRGRTQSEVEAYDSNYLRDSNEVMQKFVERRRKKLYGE